MVPLETHMTRAIPSVIAPLERGKERRRLALIAKIRVQLAGRISCLLCCSRPLRAGDWNGWRQRKGQASRTRCSARSPLWWLVISSCAS